jgi:hypothetical protein
VPFIRHTRDKRGYESTFVMHAYRPTSNEPNRTRVLYLFRTPSHVRIGRQALESEVMEALEHTHPDLSFDWTSLVREPVVVRPEAERPNRPPQRPAPRPAPVAVTPAPVVELEDESLLGRVLGPAAAALLRQRYTDLSQRILRRARTPEERDRLTERLKRLNPDDWSDEGSVRSGAQTVEAGWDAIAVELPSRRRGRRGGRRPGHEPGGAPTTATPGPGGGAETSPPPAQVSGIMDGEEDNAGNSSTYAGGPDRDADDTGHDAGVGPAETDAPASLTPAEPAGPDVPVDD